MRPRSRLSIKEVRIKVPPGSSSGRRIRLRGKGFPSTTEKPGDLFAEIRIVVPEELSARERELFDLLADDSEFARLAIETENDDPRD